jgi:CheY-like chemotaxis protein
MDLKESAASVKPTNIKSIFLAEDDLNACAAFQDALNEVAPGTRLTIVTNGDELLNLLKHYVPDLLFLDLNMPFKNGLESIKELRENKIYDHLPIVIYSASNKSSSIQVAYGFGANLFFTKPTDRQALAQSLQQILQLDWSRPALITQKYFHNNQYQAFLPN